MIPNDNCSFFVLDAFVPVDSACFIDCSCCHVYTELKFLSYFIDINECAANTHNCHVQATCTNTVGSFTCQCNVGYEGSGTLCVGK